MKNQRLNKMLGIKGINMMLKLVSSKYYQNFITNHIMPAFSEKIFASYIQFFRMTVIRTSLSVSGQRKQLT